MERARIWRDVYTAILTATLNLPKNSNSDFTITLTPSEKADLAVKLWNKRHPKPDVSKETREIPPPRKKVGRYF